MHFLERRRIIDKIIIIEVWKHQGCMTWFLQEKILVQKSSFNIEIDLAMGEGQKKDLQLVLMKWRVSSEENYKQKG